MFSTGPQFHWPRPSDQADRSADLPLSQPSFGSFPHRPAPLSNVEATTNSGVISATHHSACSWARSDALGLGFLASFANGRWALPYGGLNHLLRPIRRIRSWNRGSERNGSKAGRIRTHGLKRSSK